MQLGVSYNAFDGIDLIAGSIASIRDNVDHISVIVQNKSNYGVPFAKDDKDFLMDLRRNGVIDELLAVEAKLNKSPHLTEMRKRQVGYDTAMKAGCTHYMSMDVDEYYEEDELGIAKKYIEDEDYDGTYCRYVNYYGDKNHQLPIDLNAYVPLIYRIDAGRKYVFGNSFSTKVICDPTRQMPCSNIGFMDHVTMHHMSYVRNGAEGMRSKLENSSAKVNWNQNVIDAVVDHYGSWSVGMDALMIGGYKATCKPIHVPLTEVESIF